MAFSKMNLDGGFFRKYGNLVCSRHAHACHSLATRYFSVLLFRV